MTDDTDPDGSSDRGSSDPSGPAPSNRSEVGSLAEEAAKLFAAVAGAAAAHGVGPEASEADPDAHLGVDAGWHQWREGWGGSAECCYCPVCQLISLVRQTSPEAKAHLAEATGALLAAAGELLGGAGARPGVPMEHIDLDDLEDRENDD